jgi:type I restriction enzyme, S subunit
MADDKKPKEQQGLPEGWKWVRLGEVIEDTYPGEWGDNPTGTDNKNIFPVFSTLAIDYDGRIDFTKAVPRKLNKKKIEKLKLKKGMILIEKSGGSTDTPAGKVAILKQDFEGTCSNFIQILKPNNSVCDSYYLFYRLLYNFKNNLIEKYQQKTTGIINFILKDYFNEYIPLPPLPEQRKIAEILETVDNAIEKTEKIIEKYKRIKQGLMQDLLTKGIDENGNIRSEKTHKFKDSPLGRIPEEWEVVTINSIIKDSLISGIWGEEPKDFENTYPILRSTEISHEGRIVIKNVAFRKVKLGPSKISKYVLRNGDILIVSSSGSEELIGRVAIFKYPGNEKFLFSNFLLRLRVGEKTDSTYMFYLLSSFWYRYFLSQFQETSTGLRNFPKNEFLNYFFFPLPPLPEQKRIAEILSQIDQAIEKEEKYKEKLERLKKGLMEDLLTGKVRVNKLLEGENHEMA